MTMQKRSLSSHAILALCVAAGAARAELPDAEFHHVRNLVLPGQDDSQWLNVSWLPATNIWEARQKAAREGKPILLWYMAGEPLGAC
jgi:hypothetical protein